MAKRKNKILKISKAESSKQSEPPRKKIKVNSNNVNNVENSPAASEYEGSDDNEVKTPPRIDDSNSELVISQDISLRAEQMVESILQQIEEEGEREGRSLHCTLSPISADTKSMTVLKQKGTPPAASTPAASHHNKATIRKSLQITPSHSDKKVMKREASDTSLDTKSCKGSNGVTVSRSTRQSHILPNSRNFPLSVTVTTPLREVLHIPRLADAKINLEDHVSLGDMAQHSNPIEEQKNNNDKIINQRNKKENVKEVTNPRKRGRPKKVPSEQSVQKLSCVESAEKTGSSSDISKASKRKVSIEEIESDTNKKLKVSSDDEITIKPQISAGSMKKKLTKRKVLVQFVSNKDLVEPKEEDKKTRKKVILTIPFSV